MSRIACLLSVVVLAVLTGCGRGEPLTGGRPSASQPPAVVKVDNSAPYTPKIGEPGGTLVLSSISSPKSFNPILQKEASSSVVTGFIFSGLTRTNGATLLPEPDLAESWRVSEDGLVYTFTLRDGLRWSDGQPLTADDVKFTFDLIYDPDIPNSASDVFSIGGKHFQVEALDDRRVRFTLPTPFAPFLRGMSQEIVPRHVLEKSWKDGAFNSTWGVNTPPGKMVGSGPF
ncbi:MAG: ABC transporter substrate-binding protein, partial [Planctomycetota bacterium]